MCQEEGNTCVSVGKSFIFVSRCVRRKGTQVCQAEWNTGVSKRMEHKCVNRK